MRLLILVILGRCYLCNVDQIYLLRLELVDIHSNPIEFILAVEIYRGLNPTRLYPELDRD